MVQACRTVLKDLTLSGDNNTGLILNKYLKFAADGKENYRNGRNQLIASILKVSNDSQILYKKAFERRDRSINFTIKQHFKTRGRIAVGLGTDTPIETGLSLNFIYGTPVIPGSTLKGLSSHYCNAIWGKEEKEFRKEIVENNDKGEKIIRLGKYFEIIFGSSDYGGHITFHDSWILPTSLKDCFQKDTMTVHHPDYYQSLNFPPPPSDFDDPNPIPFISITGEFNIGLTCDLDNDEGKKWGQLSMKLLSEALDNWGIGGKTNSGYGRLVPFGTIKSAPKKLDEFQEFCKWFDQMKFSKANKNLHNQITEKIEKMENLELKKKAIEYVSTKLPGKKHRTNGLHKYILSFE